MYSLPAALVSLGVLLVAPARTRDAGNDRDRGRMEVEAALESCATDEDCEQVRARAEAVLADYRRRIEGQTREFRRLNAALAVAKSAAERQRLLMIRDRLPRADDMVVRGAGEVASMVTNACAKHKQPEQARDKCMKSLEDSLSWFRDNHIVMDAGHEAYVTVTENLDALRKKIGGENRADETEGDDGDTVAVVKERSIEPTPTPPPQRPSPVQIKRPPPRPEQWPTEKKALVASASVSLAVAVPMTVVAVLARRGGPIHLDVAETARDAGLYERQADHLCDAAPTTPATDAEVDFVDSCTTYNRLWVTRNALAGVAGVAAGAALLSGVLWAYRARSGKRARRDARAPRVSLDASAFGLRIEH